MVPQRAYHLPSLAVAGWIPYYDFSAPLPNSFRGLSWRLQLAARSLFATGNPPPIVASSNDFDGLIASKEFRVAVGLKHVQATLDHDGGVHISALLRTAAGFTPVTTVVPPWPRTDFPARARRYEPGTSSRRLRCPQGYGELSLDFGFKIGARLSLVQSALTFHLAPWAMVNVVYRVYSDGKYRIAVRGSDVPSFIVYVGWHVGAARDMATITGTQFRNFIVAGACKKAPTTRIFHVQGRVGP